MQAASPAKNTTQRLVLVSIAVLAALLLYLVACDGITVTAFRNLGSGLLARNTAGNTHGSVSQPFRSRSASLWQQRQRQSITGAAQAIHSRLYHSSPSQPLHSWLQHPNIFTLAQLGLWRTSFLGVLNTSQQQPPTAEDAVLLQHWWRCSSGGAGTMHLRGLGSAYSAVDSDYLMQLIPMKMNDHWAALNIKDEMSNNTWNLQQSHIPRHGINAWHAAAANLSSNSTYSMSTASSNLSMHSHSFDSSRCSNPPEVFRPGTMWSVITQAADYDAELYAKLLAQHTSYHQALGFTGSILLVSRSTAASLVKQPATKQGLDDGSLVVIIWDEDLVPSMPYYYQYLWYNLVMLATWGVPDIKLAMIDLDEFYVMPKDLTFTGAFKPGGCMHGQHQVKIARFWTYFGVTPAEAAACFDARKHLHSSSTSTAKRAAKSVAAGTPQEPKASNITGGVGDTKAGQATMQAAEGPWNNTKFKACKELEQSLLPDIQHLTTLGWESFFQLKDKRHGVGAGAQDEDVGSQIVSTEPKDQLSLGYIERIQPSLRWAHKSIVDPNFIAAYAVHEATVPLLGARANMTGKAVPYTCAFGIHLGNMYRLRQLGTGQQLKLEGQEGPFDLAKYVQNVMHSHG